MHGKGKEIKRCKASAYCKAFNDEMSNCHHLCVGYLQINMIYALSNIPLKYQYPVTLTPTGRDAVVYKTLSEWMGNVVDNVQKGKGLFLVSEERGNGKTSWACKIVGEYFRHVAMSNNAMCRGLFINVPEFMEDLKHSYNNPSDDFDSLVSRIKTADVVIWDDIGTEAPTPNVKTTLYRFINHRDANSKSNIYTSNIIPERLIADEWLGQTIMSRIIGHSDILEFRGYDRRLKK